MSKIDEMLAKDFPEEMAVFEEPLRTRFFTLIEPYHLDEETIRELIQELTSLPEEKVEGYLADLDYILAD
jgi:hypothetical protein